MDKNKDGIKQVELSGTPMWSYNTPFVSDDRDYWRKLYAGMAMQGLCANPEVTQINDARKTYSEVEKSIIKLAIARSDMLVDEMFREEES